MEATALGFSVFSLWHWFPENDKDVRDLIYRLKAGGVTPAFRRLAFLLSQKVHQREAFKKGPLIFVPAPPIRQGVKDHAFQLALCLSEIWGAEMSLCLERESSQSQRRAGRLERKATRIRFRPNDPTWESVRQRKKTVVFVDDVVTTGSTAQAAFLALGSPSTFNVWTLAYRPRFS